MKLHLPKTLLVAVLAACVTAPTAWAGWGTYQSKLWYYLPTDGAGAEISKDSTAEGWTEYSIVPEVVNQETTIKSFTMSAGDTLTICHNPWGTSTGASERDFKLLTIENLIVENGGDGTIKTDATNSATINTVSGAIAVVNAGALTIGTDTGSTALSGTLSNSGTLTLKGTFSVSDLSNFEAIITGGTLSDETNGFRTGGQEVKVVYDGTKASTLSKDNASFVVTGKSDGDLIWETNRLLVKTGVTIDESTTSTVYEIQDTSGGAVEYNSTDEKWGTATGILMRDATSLKLNSALAANVGVSLQGAVIPGVRGEEG